MIRALPWLIAALFCAGVVAGMAAFWPESSAPTAITGQAGTGLAAPAALADTQSALQPGHPADHAPGGRDEGLAELVPEGMLADLAEPDDSWRLIPESLLVQSRELILAGGHERAATLIRRHTVGLSPGLSPRWAECQVWLGLAEELAGNLRKAEAAYTTALRHRPGNKAEVFALAGLVRVWLAAGRTDEAVELASDLYLQSGLLTDDDQWAAAEINWLLAVGLLEARPRSGEAGGKAPWLWFEAPPPAVELMVSALWPSELDSGETTLEESGPPPVPAIQTAVEDEHGPPALLAEHALTATDATATAPAELAGAAFGQIDVNLPAQTFHNVFQQIASGPGWTVMATTAARQQLAGRSKSIVVTSQPVDLVLDLLSLSADLAWQLQGQELRIDRATPAEMAILRSRCCAGLMARFSDSFPADRRNPWCHAARGNLALEAGQPDAAAQHWHEAWRLGATGELAAGLLVNRSRLDERLGRLEDARQGLYDAIDSTWNLGLQGEAWSRIARLALARGAFDEARQAASRSARLARSDLARREAALALATAYLLQENPWAANQVIFEHRELMPGSPSEAEAAFLGSFSRYRGSQTTMARAREEPRLLAAVSLADGQPGLTPAASALIADAWQQLGFSERAAAAITPHVTVGAGEYWDGRLSLQLAVYRRLAGAPADAAQILERVASQPESPVRVSAQLELARLQLAGGEFRAAISSARSLLEPEVDDVARKEALGLMGAAYTRLEQPYAAALCFAGVCPLEAQPDETTDSTNLGMISGGDSTTGQAP
jgi:tetratricopeptide (TPR) repeat protein